ncbi:MAG: TetR/AcrR family transcriptional regulator [Thermodesulfobacteriota bacterium]
MDSSKRILTVIDQISSPDKVRRKIIDAASILYAQKGFNATSIDEISEMAGVSLPVTHRYIKNKSEIMGMILEDVLKMFQDNLMMMIKGIDNPEEKLAIAVNIYFKVIDQQREKALLIYQKSNSLDKKNKSHIMQLEVDISNIFAKIIKEGIEYGIFKRVDVDLMAYNIIILAHMWVLKRWHFKHRLSIERYLQLQLATIMDALKE